MKVMLRHANPFFINITGVQAIAQVLIAIVLLPALVHAQTYSLPLQFKSGPDGSSPYATPILDSEGNLYGTTCNDGEFASGIVFKLSPSGKETVLHAFTSIHGDGDGPYAPVLRDSAGNLYGTTQFGGIFGGMCTGYGCGIIFKIDAKGKETVLHRFNGNDGMVPEQGLIADPQGNMYGTTFQGGANGSGTVFKFSPDGAITTLYTFGQFGGGDGFWPYGGSLVRDSAGNLYGTTEYGGSIQTFGGTLFKVDPNGVETVLHEFGGSGDGAQPRGTLILDQDGNLYGTTAAGGAFNFGIVYRVDSSSGAETILYSFSGSGGDGAEGSAGLVRDKAGNLYGLTNSGGSHYLGTAFKLDTSNHETILHNFTGFDGRSPEYGMVADSKGNLYGTTFMGGRYGAGVVFKLVP
jgi:uncharacterized repeat protein (TIGR03803 family)